MIKEYLLYFFVRAFRNVLENRFLTVVTVAVITVSMLLFSSFLLVYTNLEAAMASWGHDVQVSGYLLDRVGPEEARVIMDEIRAMPEVADVQYVSKADAMASFTQSLEGVAGIVEDLGTNPLPASIEITLKEELRGSEAVQRFVEKVARPEFEDLDWSQEWVEKFYSFMALMRWSGLILGALLAAASIFIISQTIRLGFFARRDEFEILELVGATPFFTRVPFVIEGFFQGLTGAILAEVLLYGLYRVAVHQIDTTLHLSLGAHSLVFLPRATIAVLLTGGMSLGLLGSLLSVRRVVRYDVRG